MDRTSMSQPLQEHRNNGRPWDVSTHISQSEPHYFAIGDVSDVYRCQFLAHDGSERPVAVKVMRGFTSGESARQKFTEELVELVRQWQELSHPNIMECYGMCQNWGRMPGFVLPMCNGTIMEYLHPQTHSMTLKLDLLRQVASAVSYLHSAGIVHADIRGASILMQEHTPLLMDCGLSPLINYGEFTVPGVYGRSRWMAPEVLEPPDDLSMPDMGETVYSPKTDIYAFGMTILEVITGALPYNHQRHDTVVILEVIRGIRPNRPPAISDGVWNIMTACWESKPLKRPSAALVDSWLNIVCFAEVI